MQPTSTLQNVKPAIRKNGIANKLHPSDRAFHDWYRFVLSFPPHLVREYIRRFNLNDKTILLDPFCGTGTTLVEAKLNGIPSIGIEANPMPFFASSVKVAWDIDPAGLVEYAETIAKETEKRLAGWSAESLLSLPEDAQKLLLKDSISPRPLHKTLVLLAHLQRVKDSRYYRHALLALAKALVFSVSNLHFGPEVGVHPIKKSDAPVIDAWLSEVRSIAQDLRSAGENHVKAQIYNTDSRQLDKILHPNSIDAVFTSPPYPNEKDYTRTTRLESVLLGFIREKSELQNLKKGLLRSNTRNVYKGDNDDKWVEDNEEIQFIADSIEQKRIKLGKTSGFERLYGRVAKLYFGGMARHFASLRPYLKPGAQLGYVVGDQASYLQIMIRTGKLLADIAVSQGYELVGIDLFRTRLATATRMQMREEVVILRWPGPDRRGKGQY